MEDVDGVVRPRLEVTHHTERNPFDGGGREDDGLEVVLGDGLRAGKGEQETAFCHRLHCHSVKIAVPFDPLVFHFMVFGKGGRVEDDHLVAIFGGSHFEKIEDVFGESAVFFRVWGA